MPVSAGAAAAATTLQSGALALIRARPFIVNVAANSVAVPGGSQVGFYQTVPGFTAPHLIEYAVPDPFQGGFPFNLALSSDALDYGSYANGGTVSFSTSAPDEGLGTYRIGVNASQRVAGALTASITAPAAGPTTTVQPLFLPAAGPAAGGGTLNILGTLQLARAGRFDSGFVLISRAGELVDVRDLGASLSGLGSSAQFSLTALPAGLTASRYDIAVRLWSSSDPARTLTRVAAAAPVDASAGGAQSLNITVP